MGTGCIVMIENVDLRIGDRAPDVNGSVAGFDSIHRRPDRCFRGTVEIPHRICRRPITDG